MLGQKLKIELLQIVHTQIASQKTMHPQTSAVVSVDTGTLDCRIAASYCPDWGCEPMFQGPPDNGHFIPTTDTVTVGSLCEGTEESFDFQ
jgi:hypothetical protein